MGSSVVGIVTLRALQLAPSYGVSPENWRAAVAYVTARDKPQDCVAFYPSDGRMAFEYYIGQRPGLPAASPRPVLPPEPWGEVTPYVEDYASLSHSALARVRRVPAAVPHHEPRRIQQRPSRLSGALPAIPPAPSRSRESFSISPERGLWLRRPGRGRAAVSVRHRCLSQGRRANPT